VDFFFFFFFFFFWFFVKTVINVINQLGELIFFKYNVRNNRGIGPDLDLVDPVLNSPNLASI
jgi:hypothetical protein